MSSNPAWADWLTMLDRIDAAMASAVTEATRQAEATAKHEQPAPQVLGGDVRRRIDEIMAGLDARFQAARALAAQVAATMQADEVAVQAWRDSATAAKERLSSAAGL